MTPLHFCSSIPNGTCMTDDKENSLTFWTILEATHGIEKRQGTNFPKAPFQIKDISMLEISGWIFISHLSGVYNKWWQDAKHTEEWKEFRVSRIPCLFRPFFKNCKFITILGMRLLISTVLHVMCHYLTACFSLSFSITRISNIIMFVYSTAIWLTLQTNWFLTSTYSHSFKGAKYTSMLCNGIKKKWYFVFYVLWK